MRLVGLTGGIGSGKSSVSARLATLGAKIIDADAIVKDLQAPGAPVFEAMVERWGDQILTTDPDGAPTLDRAAVAGIVFADKAELEALNQLVHPAVRREMRAQMDAAADGDGVVILDIPLLAESKNEHQASAVIVVDCPVEVAVARLVEFRGFDVADAEARVAAQATREERRALADFVVDNGGGLESLDAEVARCWAWLETLPPTPWPPEKEGVRPPR
ncbi:MAG: dephospho-CoA kinase [Acidimicrobiales bacterium]